ANAGVGTSEAFSRVRLPVGDPAAVAGMGQADPQQYFSADADYAPDRTRSGGLFRAFPQPGIGCTFRSGIPRSVSVAALPGRSGALPRAPRLYLWRDGEM